MSNDNVISYFEWIDFDRSFYDCKIEKKIVKNYIQNQFDSKSFTIEYPFESSFNELNSKEEVYQNYSEDLPFSPILLTKEVKYSRAFIGSRKFSAIYKTAKSLIWLLI